MKIYAVAIFLCMYSYQMQSAQVGSALIRSVDEISSYNKAIILRSKLDAIKRSNVAFFQAQFAFAQPAKFPIKPAHEHAICQKIVDTNLQMHKDAIVFIRVVFEMKNPDKVDSRLLTPGCVKYCMNALQERPSSPKSSALIAEFFEVKKPWLKVQEVYKQALAAHKESKFFDEEE